MKSREELANEAVPEHLLSGEVEICVGHLHDAFKAGYDAAQAQMEEMAGDEKLGLIVLRPRFADGNFAGYDQIAGNYFYDTDGHIYPFIYLPDHNSRIQSLESKLKIAESALNYYSDLDNEKSPLYAQEAIAQIEAVGGGK